ncbi:hypothetical protein Ddc_11902 [Ditylenchus destructor]|nr:hypothetical protein Ddc_11902 [Ditylenchus destructor]
MAPILEILRSLPEELPHDHHVQYICYALWHLKRLQDHTESKMLNEQGQQGLGNRINRLLEHMQECLPEKNVKQKGHFLYRHGMDFAETWGNLNYFYEHGIEHLHAVYNKQARNYKMGETKRQHCMLKWNYVQNRLEARQPAPADAVEYNFETDPTHYCEEEVEDTEAADQ